jgi:hypothetical protein
MGSCCLRMGIIIKANGKMTWNKEWVFLFVRMGVFIMENGRMI